MCQKRVMQKQITDAVFEQEKVWYKVTYWEWKKKIAGKWSLTFIIVLFPEPLWWKKVN